VGEEKMIATIDHDVARMESVWHQHDLME
jgi:hypothetical protein